MKGKGAFPGGGFGLVLLAACAIGAFAVFRGLPQTGSVATAAPGSPSGLATMALGTEPPATQPEPTAIATDPMPTQPDASVSLAGDFPGPDATVPPDVRSPLPNVGVLQLARLAGELGLVCESVAPSGEGGGYSLGCEGIDALRHAKILLRANYWTLMTVDQIVLAVAPADMDHDVDKSVPLRFFAKIVDATAGGAVTAWLANHLDDDSCRSDCTGGNDVVKVVLTVGGNGGRQITVSN